MQKIKFWIFLMMLLLLSCRCIIGIFPQIGFAWVSTLMSITCFFSIFYCIIKGCINNDLVVDKVFVSLFLIYSSFVSYQLFFSGIIPKSLCQGTPKDVFHFIRSSIDIYMLSLAAFMCSKYLDFDKFAKWTIIITLVFLTIYNETVGFKYYAIVHDLSLQEREMNLPDNFVSALSMNSFVGLMLCCNLYLFDRWTKTWIFNRFIFFSIAILGFVIQSLLAERGPFVFMIITIFIMFVAKGYLNFKYGIFYSLVLLIGYVVFDLSVLGMISPELADRLTDLSGSGRYGSSDSIYYLAIKQIMDSPFWGYCCRMTATPYIGAYPHNLFLEIIMTVGFLFALPIIYLIGKAFVQSYKLIKSDCQESLVGYIFIYRTLCLLTSASVVCNVQFWFSFAFVLATIKYLKLEK